MKSSGYTRDKTREVGIGGAQRLKRKISRRKAEGQDLYSTERPPKGNSQEEIPRKRNLVLREI